MRILIFTLLFLIPSLNNAQSSEYSEIEKTLNYYLDGGTNNDFGTLKKAFHENATMKFVANGEYTEVNAIAFFQKGMKPGPPQNRNTRIVYINVTGNAANAQIEIEYPQFSFIDYMNLLKVNGEWKIVSKIFFRKVREEESGT